MKSKFSLALFILTLCICAFAACGKSGDFSGRYCRYLPETGEYVADDYFVIDGNGFTSSDFKTGKLTYDGGKVTLFSDGNAVGTLENYVLKTDGGVYVCAKHRCEYGEWEVSPPSCFTAGLKSRVCECGKAESEVIAATGHTVADPAFPVCAECGLILAQSLDFSHGSVNGGAPYKGAVIIPGIIGGERVERIGDGAFGDCKSLVSLTVPESVTKTGKDAFRGCTSLDGVYINNIAAWCGMNFGRGDIYSNPLYYAGNLYVRGELVSALEIPDGVEKIADFAFCGCTSVKSVNMGKAAEIGDCAFWNCVNLKNVGLGGVTRIGESAFGGCVSLESLTLPYGLKDIGYGAFSYCPSLKEAVFENAEGWEVSEYGDMSYSERVTLSDPLKNAENLAGLYRWFFWKR